MSGGAFLGLTALRLLELNKCQLRTMPPVTDSIKHTLVVLYLHDNLITNVHRTYFQGFVKMLTLSLAKNRLTQIPDLSPLSSTLRWLVISENAITKISHILYEEKYLALGYISLRKNMIKEIPIDVYLAWPAIYRIVMRGNNLSSFCLPISLLLNSTPNIRLQLGHNPWRCDSGLTLLLELNKGPLKIDDSWNQGRKLGSVWISDYPDMECAEPPPFAGMWLGDLSKLT